jgi:hypothetical protein
MPAAIAGRSRRRMPSRNTKNISPWVMPLAPICPGGAPMNHTPMPESSQIVGTARSEAFG